MPAINKATAESTRLSGADALRALAAIAVVVVHTDHWPLQDTGADHLVWTRVDLSMRFCVPVFVMLSGLLLGLRGRIERPGPFLSRRLRRTLLPFAAWVPVYCAAGLWWMGDIHPGAVGGWLLGGAGHLYFLLLIPQLYAVYLLWPRGLRPALWAAGIAMAVQVALETVRLAAPMPQPLGGLALSHGYELFPFWIGDFATGIAAGRLLARRRDRGDHPRAAVACLMMLPASLDVLLVSPVGRLRNSGFAQGTGAFLRPTVIPLVLLLVGAAVLGTPAAFRRAPWLRRPVRSLSDHSLGVYITHPLFAYLLGHYWLTPVLQQHLPGSAIGFLLLAAGTLLMGLAASMLLTFSPLAALIGAERRRIRRAWSAPDHHEGHELLGRGQRTVMSHHPRLRGVD